MEPSKFVKIFMASHRVLFWVHCYFHPVLHFIFRSSFQLADGLDLTLSDKKLTKSNCCSVCDSGQHLQMDPADQHDCNVFM